MERAHSINKMASIKIVVVFALFAGASLASGEKVYNCPSEKFTVIGKTCFMVTSVKANFDTGFGYCASNMGAPAVIESKKQMDLIADFLKESVYLGINDIGSEGTFIDLSAQPIAYSNFNNGEPNNVRNEDCVVAKKNRGYSWNDVDCSKKFKMLCQAPVIEYEELKDDGKDLTCDRTKCPEYRDIGYYDAKGCQPVYEDGSCCATKFDCQEPSQEQDNNKCYYKGTEYGIYSQVPVNDVCSNCLCFKPPTYPHTIFYCTSIECPSMFQDLEPGCREIFEEGSCCSVKTKCVDPSVPVEEEKKCETSDKSFSIGAMMDFDDEPCQSCICTEGYTGPHGPGCKKLDCGYDFRYIVQMSRGCIPQYFRERCCTFSFICPGDDIISASQEDSNPEGATEDVCSFNGTTVARGRQLATTDPNVACTCNTPPDVTCVQAGY